MPSVLCPNYEHFPPLTADNRPARDKHNRERPARCCFSASFDCFSRQSPLARERWITGPERDNFNDGRVARIQPHSSALHELNLVVDHDPPGGGDHLVDGCVTHSFSRDASRTLSPPTRDGGV
jgi:hypothetical protein